jgi:hypothetical protein
LYNLFVFDILGSPNHFLQFSYLSAIDIPSTFGCTYSRLTVFYGANFPGQGSSSNSENVYCNNQPLPTATYPFKVNATVGDTTSFTFRSGNGTTGTSNTPSTATGAGWQISIMCFAI